MLMRAISTPALAIAQLRNRAFCAMSVLKHNLHTAISYTYYGGAKGARWLAACAWFASFGLFMERCRGRTKKADWSVFARMCKATIPLHPQTVGATSTWAKMKKTCPG